MATKAGVVQSQSKGVRGGARAEAARAAKPPAKPEVDAKARRYDPAETRTRVLEAAYLLFGTRGYANTGTADIAAQADVSEGSIFYHFGSKRALLVELGKLHGQKMVDAMQGGDALEDLTFEVTLNRCFDFCEVNNVWEEVVVRDGDCPASTSKNLKHSPEAEPFFHATRELLVRWTRSHMEAVAASKGNSAVDSEIAASLVFSLVGDGLQQYFRPDTTPEMRKRIRAECIRFCTAATERCG